MEEYGHFEYKKTIGAQNDYRTSTCRDHLRLPEQFYEPINHHFSQENNQYFQNIGNEESHLTESQEQFSRKMSKLSVFRNPSVRGVHFMKSFKDTHLRNYPKLIPPVTSTSKNDYHWKPKAFEEHIQFIHPATERDANENMLIDRCKFGFGKLLDPSATTSNLAFRAYSTEESGKTSKNIITFWNWKSPFEKKPNFWNVANNCSTRHRCGEYQNPVKHVPNSGLTTEAKSNYVQQFNLTDFDSFHTNTKSISFKGLPNVDKSENTIYGSGIRIQKYLS